MREKILDSITDFKSKISNENIPIISKEIKVELGKYNKSETIYYIYINGNKLKKSSEYFVTYKCLKCNKPNTVSTTQFIRKIRNCTTGCYLCNELNICDDLNNLKLNNNSENLEKLYLRPNKKKKLSYSDNYLNSIDEFNSYPDQYKNSYYLHHLTIDDYNRIKDRLVSYCYGNKSDINNYDYWHIYKTDNLFNFTPIIYDKINDTIFKPNQPVLKCDNCNNCWRARSLNKFTPVKLLFR